jgi:TRAP-type C4-dicarboxylate transport system substrate-binding protein
MNVCVPWSIPPTHWRGEKVADPAAPPAATAFSIKKRFDPMDLSLSIAQKRRARRRTSNSKSERADAMVKLRPARPKFASTMLSVAGWVLGGFLLAVTAASAATASNVWDMPTPYPENSFHTANIKAFAEDVKAATGGGLTLAVHPAGSLIQHPEIKNAVRNGAVPIGEFLLSRLANENAVFEVDAVPFLATNYFAARELWKVSRDTITRLLDAEGLQLLFAVPWPPQGLYSAKPVHEIDALRDMKFRVYNAATERLAQLAGAVPTQVEVSDVPQAFASGRLDAMIASPSTGAESRAWDYVNNFYNIQAWLPKNVVVVHKQVFQTLDEPVRTAILNAAAAAEERGWQMSVDETNKTMQVMRDHGMIVADPAPALKQGLQEIGTIMTREWAQRAGPEGAEILRRFGPRHQAQ